MDFTHFNEQGRARMVDVTGKAVTDRVAVAAGRVYMNAETLAALRESNEIAHDPNVRTYSVDEAFEELDR